MTNKYPASTVEFQPVTVTVNNLPVTTGVMFSVVLRNPSYGDTVPGAWVTPINLGGLIGVMIAGLTAGVYDVWVQVSSSPETPVINAGSFQVI